MCKEFKESLQLDKFTINKPKEWALDEVELEIDDYDYVSTKITINDLKILRNYIDFILNQTDEQKDNNNNRRIRT